MMYLSCKSYCAFICIIVAANYAVADEISGNVISKLFSKSGPSLRPDEVQEMLKNALETSSESLTQEERKELSDLLEVGEISELKCNQDSIKVAEVLYKQNREYKLTIVPYLRKFKEMQYKVCRPILVNQLEELVFGITPEEEKKISRLCTFKNSGRDPYDELIDNIVDVVKNQAKKSNFVDFTDTPGLTNLYIEAIEDTCKPIRSRLDTVLSIYDLLFPEEVEGMSGEEAAKDMIKNIENHVTLLWTSYDRICKNAMGHPEFFVEDVQEILLKQKEKKGLIKKIQKFFNSKGKKQ